MTRGSVSSVDVLTEVETRAGLRAVCRVLDVVGQQARRHRSADELADMLTAARTLPEMLAEPDEFRVRFRPALQRLADRSRDFAPVLNEFDRSTGVRRCRAEDDPWFDCGGGG